MAGQAAAQATASPFVDIADVALTYGGAAAKGGGTLALEHCTLGVGKGEFVAVVGPSGCGKSTLLKLVSGLHPPSAGRVAVDGEAVTRPLKIVGMAFQNPIMLPWRTTLANVLLPLEIVEPHRSRFRRERAAYAERARRLLATVNLAGFEERFPWQLSGGMQQRASLCRALIHEPELLLLDEPFAALDAFTREELWDVLQALWLERRFTCVLVTHDLREAVYLADRVVVISNRPGRVVMEQAVGLPRPRRLANAWDRDFVDLVHVLRDKISEVRQAA
ncbi:MAG: ABC transporter ATP-binding protein [Alphaproteobacteria bacterium]|nr:ABC transporter ATP-binding protein [Alphaproteobacteria bacterium]